MARRITPDERKRRIAALNAGRAEGLSLTAIARLLDIPPATFGNWVKNQEAAAQERVVAPPPVMRPCLRCRRDFPSEGIHNRMCDPCRNYAPVTDSPYCPDPGGATGRQVRAARV